LKQNKNKNKNKLLIKIKKIKLKQIVFKFIINLNRTNSKDFFTKFYNFAIESLINFKLSKKLLNKNIINFILISFALCLLIFFLKKKNRKIYINSKNKFITKIKKIIQSKSFAICLS